MEPNDRERVDLGDRIRAIRLERFEGNRRAAYNHVGVNAATWDKAENGAADLAERSLVRIVKGLWPETGGDWRRIDPPLGGEPLSLEDQVRQSDLSPTTKDYIIAVLRGESPPPPTEGVKGA